MQNALTLTEKETFFLKENRQDPVTGDGFDIGDEVVFCASCKSAFLKESWEYMNSKHCGQTATLKEFPAVSKLTLSKPIVYDFQKADGGNRTFAYIIDSFIAVVLGSLLYNFFIELEILSYSDAEFWSYGTGCAYMVFRDVILRKSSIGKRFMGLYFIHTKTKKVASPLVLSLRNAVYWVCLFIVISIIATLEFTIDADAVIAIVGGFCLIIANITHVVAVLANQNNIFDKMLKIELVEKK
jgi:uncharacterized RDD family membrane protein YckC